MQTDLMSVEQLEQESPISRYTWRTWIREKRIPHVRLGRRRVFVTRHDFEAFLRASRVEARPESRGRGKA